MASIGLISCSSDRVPLPAVEVVVIGTEYAFDAPKEIRAGVLRLCLLNEGRSELHNAALIRLADGHDLDDFSAWMADSLNSPPWAVHVGGVESIPPGEGAEVVVILEPGPHLIVCYHGEGVGKPHHAEGMIAALNVVDSDDDTLEPNFDGNLQMFDYGYTVTGSLDPGLQVLRVVGAGPQPHNVLFWRLDEGKVAADLSAWLESDRSAPRPGRPIGGVTALSKGERAYLPLELDSGTYVLLCLVPDQEDGRIHMSHGMLQAIVVGL